MSGHTDPVFTASAVNSYIEGLSRQVPGYASLHRMITMLLAERTPVDGRVLVLGAGGGQEIKSLAQAREGWSFDGVDPSPDMLRLAGEVTAPYGDRVRLHAGYIKDAPEGPFDAATSILVFHFIPLDQRLETLRQIKRRMKPGAPFVAVHLSFPQQEPERTIWIDRHVAFGLTNGTDPTQAQNAREAMRSRLHVLSPDDDVTMLGEAGFTNVSLFYAGLSIKGWVCYAA